MNIVLKVFLSMSFSGSLLILVLLLGERFLKDKISQQWQYYIWLIVILRLLFPFGPETSLLGKIYQTVDQAITQTSLPQKHSTSNIPEDVLVPTVVLEQNNENKNSLTEDLTTVHPLQDIKILLTNHIWLIWFVVMLGLLIRKITIYQGFIRYIRAGLIPVSDIEILDRLSIIAKQTSIRNPIELCVNPLVSSPLLIGFFHPCIVLPSTDIPKKDFQYIILHELIHYKRWDIFYKWLVQITVCLHWFNPLVYLMSQQITKICEFSCDEAVLTKIGGSNAQDYGKTLLDAMAAVGRYKENFGVITLNENKQILKERLGAIMNFKKRSTKIRILTGILTLCIMSGAAFVGVYPAAAAGNHITDKPQETVDKTTQEKTSSSRYARMTEKYYEDGSLPLFQMAFCNMNEEEQSEWLNRIFADRNLVFFGAAVNLLDEDCVQIQHLAETIYKENDIVYFSNLAMHMGEDSLKVWLDRALEDGKWSFQSVLFHMLDRDDEFDELEKKQEKEWEEAQIAEYGAVGVTINGKDYYYQGQLVNIFLDIRSNKSFYTLNMNPNGTINIKIVRNEKNEMIGVAYMTEAEVIELFGDDKEDSDDETDVEIIPVNFKNITAEETIFLGEYILADGDKIRYDIFAETGNGIEVFFAKDEQKDIFYWFVHNLRQPDKPLKIIADFIVEPPTKPGIYKLFLRATDGTLGNVKGSISIASADES